MECAVVLGEIAKRGFRQATFWRLMGHSLETARNEVGGRGIEIGPAADPGRLITLREMQPSDKRRRCGVPSTGFEGESPQQRKVVHRGHQISLAFSLMPRCELERHLGYGANVSSGQNFEQ